LRPLHRHTQTQQRQKAQSLVLPQTGSTSIAHPQHRPSTSKELTAPRPSRYPGA
jgi:hypothetical protein